MAQQKGTEYLLKVNISGTYHPFTHTTSHEFGSQTGMLDITTKDSAGDKEVMPGLREKTFSMEMQADRDDTYNIDYLYAQQEAGTKLQFKFTDGVTGHKEFTFYAYVSNLSISAPNEEIVTASCEISITGAVTYTTI